MRIFLDAMGGDNAPQAPVEGALEALRKAGVDKESVPVLHGEYYSETAGKVIDAYLASHEAPDAIFCFSDLMAIGVMRVLLSHHLRIPEDVAVIGFDNIPYAAMTSPSLSSVGQDMRAIGYEAARLRINLVANHHRVLYERFGINQHAQSIFDCRTERVTFRVRRSHARARDGNIFCQSRRRKNYQQRKNYCRESFHVVNSLKSNS